MRTLILMCVTAATLVGCGPDVAPDGGCHMECVSTVDPNRRMPPHCDSQTDGGQNCVCEVWQPVCD